MIELSLPMPVRVEAMPDDAKMIAFLSGPLVLAGNVGPNDKPWEGPDPALVTDQAAPTLVAAGGLHQYRLGDQGKPGDLALAPFFAQHNNRTAVYFRRFDSAAWQTQRATWEGAARVRAALEARTVDVIRLGEQQPEVDHAFTSKGNSATVPHIVERSRIVNEGYFEFDLKAAPGPLALQVTYGGRKRDTAFRILVDGTALATETLPGAPTAARNVKDYAIPAVLTRGKSKVRVRFEADTKQGVEVYMVRMMRGETA